MKIDRITNARPKSPKAAVTVKRCGNVTEIRYMAGRPPEIMIEKLTAELYMDKLTGEVRAFRHHNNRAEDKGSVAQSLRKLRDLINANMEAPERALWVTLTYQERTVAYSMRSASAEAGASPA